MGTFTGYRCSVCSKEYTPESVTYTCPADGGNLDVVLDWQTIGRTIRPSDFAGSSDASIWRYLPLLPVRDPGHLGTALRAVGWTPLLSPDRLRRAAGLPHLWLKDDGRNPTASFKDRASAVVVARAQEVGARTVVTASTGNAGAALAGMAAAAGIPAVILAPKTAPPAKVAQLLMFGSRVILVDGTYDQAFDLTLQAAEEFGWYCRNTGYNPFTAEGKKTCAFEIAEQFTAATGAAPDGGGGWAVPDAVFVSVGDGNILTGLQIGFENLLQLGWIDRQPRLYGVQSEKSAAIYNAFAARAEHIAPVRATTLADSISVDLPRDGLRALRAVRRSRGAVLSVSDEDILAAMSVLGRQAAVFAEPAGAAAYAGLRPAADQSLISPADRVVVLNTGNGLKDVQSAILAAGQATVIEPDLAALRRALA